VHRAFFVELRSHELWGSEDAAGVRPVHRRRKSEVPNPDLATAGVNKYVFALDISMNDLRRLVMQVLKSIEDLNAPTFDNPESGDLVLLNVAE
jgi:hypothetical protein